MHNFGTVRNASVCVTLAFVVVTGELGLHLQMPAFVVKDTDKICKSLFASPFSMLLRCYDVLALYVLPLCVR